MNADRKMPSRAMAASIAAAWVITRPSASVMEAMRPPAAGTIDVTSMSVGSGWVTRTSVSVWPGAGVAVTTRVRL